MHKKIIVGFVIFLLLVSGGFVLVFHVLPLVLNSIPLFPLIDVETQRLDSPDGKVDAVLIERDAGAMTVARDLVYIVPDNQKPAKKDPPVFQAKRVFGLKVEWQNNYELLIEYDKAEIEHFRNYLYPFPEDLNYRIDIRERPIEADSP